MIKQISISEILISYLDRFPNDKERLQPLFDLLKSGEDYLSRKNMSGHITASGFVVKG